MLKTLKLSYFRNYTQLSFSPFARTLIVGDNGQGKTNLLEALILVTGRRSFRPALPESLIQNGKDQAFLSVELLKENKKFVLSCALDRFGKKQFFLNEKKCLSSSLAKELPVILFSPESLSLLKGPADQRRIYMDEWLNMLGHSVIVREFKKALAQKNHFLKEARLSSAPFPVALWESVNQIFMEKSWQLSTMREQALKDLSGFVQQAGSFLFAGAKDLEWIGPSSYNKGIHLTYERRGFSVSGAVAGEESLFRKKVWEKAEEEKLAGLSLCGAHRDDFVLHFGGQDSRYFCSQGQQRTLILSLKMAQILKLNQIQNASPLLLLDDIFSEIDDNVLFNLLQFLEMLPTQTILTSTREPRFLNKRSFQNLFLKSATFKDSKSATFKASSSYKVETNKVSIKEKTDGNSQRQDSACL